MGTRAAAAAHMHNRQLKNHKYYVWLVFRKPNRVEPEQAVGADDSSHFDQIKCIENSSSIISEADAINLGGSY